MRAIVVQRRLSNERSNLDELQSLAESADYVVVERVEQIRKPDPAYQIGRGKVKELVKLVKDANVDKIIFDNQLRPVQAYNLAKEAGVEVIDRFQLILEIFSKRASTTEAKLQVQLAKLQYELAYSKEKVRLAKMGEQPGFMGLGSYEADVYYETIKRQVDSIKRKLSKARGRRLLYRSRRGELGFPSISLAGYTNAGKSALFNALTNEDVPVSAMLFTTLSTTIRLLDLFGRKALLIDTVGFIDRLPITLIEAFRSTLEETALSDLILLVVDISEPMIEVKRKLSCCFKTLRKIEASEVPVVTALNKIDLISNDEADRRVEVLKDLTPNPVLVSALHKMNLELLRNELRDQLKGYVQASFYIPANEESISFISWLFDRSNVQSVSYEGDKVAVTFEAMPPFVDVVRMRVKTLNGKFSTGLAKGYD